MSLDKRLDRLGGTMTRAGTSLTRWVSLPIAGVMAGSIKAAIDYESAFAGVAKTVDASERQLRKMRREIRQLAKETPASTTEIAAVAEAAGQLGIQVPAIMGFTKVMIDLGNTTNLSADTAATALARLANITQMNQKNFDRLGATVVDLGNKGAATEEEIVMMGMRIAGAGHQIGLTEAQILSFAESLSSVGVRVEAGGSAISRVFVEIATAVEKGGRDLRTYASVADVTTAEFASRFKDDAAGAVIDFIEGLGRMKKEGASTFAVLDRLGLSEIRVRDALLRAAGAGDLFRRSQEVGNRAWRENNALTEEASKRYATQASKLKVLWNQIKDIAITLGNDLMPVVKDVAEVVRDWLKWFRQLDPATRALFIKGALSAMVLGPALRLMGGIAKTLAFILRTSKSIAAVGLWKTLTGAGLGAAGTGAAGGAAGTAARGAGAGLLARLGATVGGGALAGGGIAAGIGTLVYIGVRNGIRDAERRDAARATVQRFGSTDPRSKDALRELGLSLDVANQRIAQTREFLANPPGGMRGPLPDLDEMYEQRRKIIDQLRDMRMAEVKGAIEPLQDELEALKAVNGGLSKQQRRRVNAAIAAEKYGKALEIVREEVKKDTKEYAEHAKKLRKVQDGWQGWSKSGFEATDQQKALNRELRELKQLSPSKLLAFIEIYGDLETAARAAADQQARINAGLGGWNAPPSRGGRGGGGSSRPSVGGKTPLMDRPMKYRVRGPGLFRVGPIDEEIEMRPQGSGGRGGRGGPLLNVENLNIDLGGRGDLREAAREAADELMDVVAGRLEEAWGNKPS